MLYLGMSFLGYVVAEVTRGYLLEEDEQKLLSEKQRRVSRFMKTPRELEKVNLLIGLLCEQTVTTLTAQLIGLPCEQTVTTLTAQLMLFVYS